MKLYKIHPLIISFFLTFCSTISNAQNASILSIGVGDDRGSATYEMLFGNHVSGTWGMGGEKDSLDPTYIEKESPPLPPGLGVVWRPSRSGVSWGIGFLKYDIKDWTDAAGQIHSDYTSPTPVPRMLILHFHGPNPQFLVSIVLH